MNAMVPANIEFRTSYGQLQPIERVFVDGYVKALEAVAERTGARLLAVLNAPVDADKLDDRALAMLSRGHVRSAITERVREISDLSNVSVYRTMKEVAGIAYSSMAHYLDIESNIGGFPEIDLFKCTPEQLACIKEFSWEDKPRGGRKVTIKLHDKLAALDKLMRHQGLLADDAGEGFRASIAADAGPKSSGVPAAADEQAAAELYSRTING